MRWGASNGVLLARGQRPFDKRGKMGGHAVPVLEVGHCVPDQLETPARGGALDVAAAVSCQRPKRKRTSVGDIVESMVE